MSQLPFVKASDVAGEFRTPPRTSKLLLAPRFGGVKNVSMGMNITEVGSMIPDHVHDESEEVLFLISGRAKIVIEGEGEWEIGPETAFYSPIGKKHRVENIGNQVSETRIGQGAFYCTIAKFRRQDSLGRRDRAPRCKSCLKENKCLRSCLFTDRT